MRLFLDANILFSASIRPEGRVRAVVDLALTESVELVTSPHAKLEARRNIQAKFAESINDLEKLLKIVTEVGEADTALVRWASQYLPDKDAPILAAAVSSASDILVTGDKKHFGEYFGKELRGVLVLSPAQAFTKFTNQISNSSNESKISSNTPVIVDEVADDVELGFLDYLSLGSEAEEEASKIIKIIIEDTEGLSKTVSFQAEKLIRFSRIKGRGQKTKRDIESSVGQSVDELNAYAENLVGERRKLDEKLEEMFSNYEGVLKWLSNNSDAEEKGLIAYRGKFEAIVEMVASSRESISHFRKSVEGVANMNFDQKLTKVSRKVVHQLDHLLETFKVIEEKSKEAVNKIVKALN